MDLYGPSKDSPLLNCSTQAPEEDGSPHYQDALLGFLIPVLVSEQGFIEGTLSSNSPSWWGTTGSMVGPQQLQVLWSQIPDRAIASDTSDIRRWVAHILTNVLVLAAPACLWRSSHKQKRLPGIPQNSIGNYSGPYSALPKGPYTSRVYTWASEAFLCPYCGTYVCTLCSM